jgi:rare lipoprotein A
MMQMKKRMIQWSAALALTSCFAALLVVGCSSTPPLSDGKPAKPAVDVSKVPDAVPKDEPISITANKPYTVMGVRYEPMTKREAYRNRGIASWYGTQFHGRATALGETYDMYKMTAAHTTLPLPSYALVTLLKNGVKTDKSVVVRVNDRGPFAKGREIDLSYAAASRLGIVNAGTAEVEVEAVFTPDQMPPAKPSYLKRANETSEKAPDAPVQSVEFGYIVQLGFFGAEDNAAAFLAHLQTSRLNNQFPAYMEPATGGYRVFVGLYKSREDAEVVERHLKEAFGLTTFLTSY